jgi:hypothetical protein
MRRRSALPRRRELSPAFATWPLVACYVIAAVGKLDSGDLIGAELDFEICLHYFDIEQFALLWIPAIGSCEIEGEITVVSFDEAVHGAQHGRDIATPQQKLKYAKSLNPLRFNACESCAEMISRGNGKG